MDGTERRTGERLVQLHSPKSVWVIHRWDGWLTSARRMHCSSTLFNRQMITLYIFWWRPTTMVWHCRHWSQFGWPNLRWVQSWNGCHRSRLSWWCMQTCMVRSSLPQVGVMFALMIFLKLKFFWQGRRRLLNNEVEEESTAESQASLEGDGYYSGGEGSLLWI